MFPKPLFPIKTCADAGRGDELFLFITAEIISKQLSLKKVSFSTITKENDFAMRRIRIIFTAYSAENEALYPHPEAMARFFLGA